MHVCIYMCIYEIYADIRDTWWHIWYTSWNTRLHISRGYVIIDWEEKNMFNLLTKECMGTRSGYSFSGVCCNYTDRSAMFALMKCYNPIGCFQPISWSFDNGRSVWPLHWWLVQYRQLNHLQVRLWSYKMNSGWPHICMQRFFQFSRCACMLFSQKCLEDM